MSSHDVRPAAVAGLFYPGDPAALAGEVDRLLAAAPGGGALPVALIVPHAGYRYSGPIAASAYALLRDAGPRVRRVVLLGPSHFVPLRGLALPGAASLETPLGRVPVDPDGAERASALPEVTSSAAAHAREHSLEVQLPFLQRLLPGVPVVPLVVGQAAPEAVARVIEALWAEPGTLVLVSSDLSHYLPWEVARGVDADTARRILALDERIASDEACGSAGIRGLLVAARRRGLSVRQLDLRNSGDTDGDKGRVVGYGAFAFEAPAVVA
jgi:AmmeMemoRadiSam system protein B